MKRILCVVGARPNYMKMAPIIRAAAGESSLDCVLIHTGQHYDPLMNDRFFEDLELPRPEVNLGVGSANHALQTAAVMKRFDPVVAERRPDGVLVVGDINSTLACTLVAAKRNIPVFHVEAGLRSFDRTMPEELNRILVDQLSDLLFTTERTAHANLLREGIDPARVHFVGNVMIDTLLHCRPRALPPEETFAAHGLPADFGARGFGLVTLHRPSNVDDPKTLLALLRTLGRIAEDLPLVFPLHPRTAARIDALGDDCPSLPPQLAMIDPLGYLAMLGLMVGATAILTDSGGMQEEATCLGIPCLTLRDNTERPVTVSEGTNVLVGSDPEQILGGFARIRDGTAPAGRVPELWDGRAAERIVGVLAR